MPVTYKFFGMNSLSDPLNVGAPDPNSRELVFTEGVELVNADPDNNGGCLMRPGFAKRYSGDVRTMWANDDLILFQEGVALKSFNPTNNSTAFVSMLLDADVSAVFCDVNGLVVYSDATVLRKVYQGVDQAFPAITEQFKIPTPPGQCLALFYRRLLVGVEDVLHVTDPDTVDLMDERLCRFPLGGTILMIAPVDDGVYVSTDKVILFLGGRGPLDWSQPGAVRKVADFPAIRGTAVFEKADQFNLDKLDGNVVMFAGEQGYCIGANGGLLLNVTNDKVRPGVHSQGTAVYRERDGLFHYLALYENGSGAVVNAATKGVAAYDGYDFRSVVRHKGRYFACNEDGIYELTGKKDDGEDIESRWLSGVSTAGSGKVKYFPNANLKLRCEGKLELSVTVDERRNNLYPVDFAEGQEGVHTKRRKLAQGVTGSQVQVGWRNLEGSDFHIQEIAVDTIPTKMSV